MPAAMGSVLETGVRVETATVKARSSVKAAAVKTTTMKTTAGEPAAAVGPAAHTCSISERRNGERRSEYGRKRDSAQKFRECGHENLLVTSRKRRFACAAKPWNSCRCEAAIAESRTDKWLLCLHPAPLQWSGGAYTKVYAVGFVATGETGIDDRQRAMRDRPFE
jgi:hypothetical protein